MEYWKQELYHHGILGMKWGKRNGPPYPLSPGQHSESEKKAGWRKSLGRSGDRADIARDRANRAKDDAKAAKKLAKKYTNAMDRKAAKREAKAKYLERDRRIQDEYDTSMRRIEAPYKRGQKLSDKDIAREMAADDKARKAWAKSKEQYKTDLRIAKDKFGGSLAEKEQNLIDTAKEKWKSDWKSDNRSYLGIAGGTLVRNLAIGAGAAAVAVGIMYMRSGGTEMLGNFDMDVLGYMKGLKDVEIVGNIANLAIKAGTVSAVAKIGHKFYKNKIENSNESGFSGSQKTHNINKTKILASKESKIDTHASAGNEKLYINYKRQNDGSIKFTYLDKVATLSKKDVDSIIEREFNDFIKDGASYTKVSEEEFASRVNSDPELLRMFNTYVEEVIASEALGW